MSEDRQQIRLTNGDSLGVTRAEYDAARDSKVQKKMEDTGVHTLCNAPFTTMNFNQLGGVSLCNHDFRPYAQVDENFSIMETWNGTTLRKKRVQFMRYELDKEACLGCVRQIACKQFRDAFSVMHFDNIKPDSFHPKYPKRLIFYLNNTCNLACIMCNGALSSRHRKEFEKLPPIQSPYGEKFFQELEEILPHVEFLEFYGGEPFLVKEHYRIFEILEKVGSKCGIYVNTNATAFHPKAKHYLETLNFNFVAVSMDAVNPKLHAEVRYGLDSRKFMQNIKYLLMLRKKKENFQLLLNVTEHRKNWFDLPEIFRFAEIRKIQIHVNTCVHPMNVTMYTLPNDELSYILEFFEMKEREIEKEFPDFFNRKAYAFLISLVKEELNNRGENWEAQRPDVKKFKNDGLHTSLLSDGRIGVPMPGYAPFETSEKMLAEIERIQQLNETTQEHLYQSILKDLKQLVEEGSEEWGPVIEKIESLTPHLV